MVKRILSGTAWTGAGIVGIALTGLVLLVVLSIPIALSWGFAFMADGAYQAGLWPVSIFFNILSALAGLYLLFIVGSFLWGLVSGLWTVVRRYPIPAIAAVLGLVVGTVLTVRILSAPEPTRTEQIAADMFWEVYAKPLGLTRSTSLDDATWEVSQAFFALWDDSLLAYERRGIDPFEHWPVCIAANSYPYNEIGLRNATTAWEAGMHADRAFNDIRILKEDLDRVPLRPPANSVARCEAAHDEIRQMQ